MVAYAFLTIGSAISTPACESSQVDRNFGTEAGADFDAPAHEVRTDGAGEADAGVDAGPVDTGAGADPGTPSP
jgi:hypothetical protein